MQRRRAFLQPLTGASDGAGGSQRGHALQRFEVVGAQLLVGVPVFLATLGQQPVPGAWAEEAEQQGGYEAEEGDRFDGGQCGEEQGRHGEGDEELR